MQTQPRLAALCRMKHSIMKQNNAKVKKALIWAGVAGFWLLVWQMAYYAVGRDLLLASPASVLKRLAQLVITGEFWQIIANSFCRIMAGFLLGLLLGTALGVLTARWSLAYRIVQLPMSMIKAAPVASFVILALVWISGRNLSIFIAFLMVLPMVWSSVDQGIKSADVQLLEAAATYRLSRLQTVRAVYIPAVMPYFLSVCRVAMGFAWKAGIAGEVIAIPKNAIGTQLYDAKIYLETTDLFAWTVVIIVLSVLIEKLFTKGVAWFAGKWGAHNEN